ncbi:hypothetical protein BGX28_009766 [Mortierella sp. GBA30]|nr:hypothetical protein BGX28_009766 [Mortierella sp. GBA30]
MKPPSFLTFVLAAIFFSGTSARLTTKERLDLASESENPDYCSACLRKGMTNHFPHACLKDMPDPIKVATESNVGPDIARCICLAFMDVSWMTADCSTECEFAKYKEAMQMIPKIDAFPGCDAWVDLKTITELDVEGWPKRDPNYKPEVYSNEGAETAASLNDVLKDQQDELDALDDVNEVGMDGEGEDVVDWKNAYKDEL